MSRLNVVQVGQAANGGRRTELEHWLLDNGLAEVEGNRLRPTRRAIEAAGALT